MIKMKYTYLCLLGLILWSIHCVAQVEYGDSLYINLSNQTKAISRLDSVYNAYLPFETRLSQTLEGKLAGTTILSTSAMPTGTAPKIYVRGTSTYNTSAGALVLIDGFEGDWNSLLPEEVNSVEVLKDAAALARFGMRAANGVVLVSTRRANSDKLKIQLTTKVGSSLPLRTPSFVSAGQYASLYNEALSNDLGKWTSVYDQSSLQKYNDNSDPYAYPNVNWQEQVLSKCAWFESGTLSLSTGNRVAKLYAVFGLTHAPSLIQNNSNSDLAATKNLSSFLRFNARANLDVKINPVFALAVNFSGNICDAQSPNVEMDDLFNMIYFIPSNAFPVMNKNGTWAATSVYTDNPAASVFGMGKRSIHSRSIKTDVDFSQTLDKYVKGLSFHEAVSFYGYGSTGYFYQKDVARYQMRMINGQEVYTKVAGNNTEYSINESEQYRKQLTRISVYGEAKYARSFAQIHRIASSFGAMYSHCTVDGNNAPYVHAGLFGELSYDYDNRYFLQFGFAYNGSENLADKHKYGFFPSLSFAWQMANEEFYKVRDILTDCKFRLSAGMLGNGDWSEARFLYQTYYANAGTYRLGSTTSSTINTLALTAVGNSDLNFEKDYRANIGWDFALLNKISSSLDFFVERRTDIITQCTNTTPAWVSNVLPYINFGTVQNIGGEWTLSYQDHKDAFSWGANVNIGYAKNKIIKQDEVTHKESYSYRTGYPVGQYFGLEALGYFDSQQEIENSPKQLFSITQPGDIKYKDQNNDGVIDENDQIAIGYSSIPQLTFGIDCFFKWKGLDASIAFDGEALKSTMLSGNIAFAFYNNGQVPTMALNRWAYYPEQGIDTRSTATYPRLSLMQSANNNIASTQWLRNTSFCRLRHVEVGYDFATLFPRPIVLSKLRWFVAADNVATMTGLKDFDPEIISGYPICANVLTGITFVFK